MPQYRIGDNAYDMDPTTWTNVDVSSVQRALGCGLATFMERLDDMDIDAIQAMLWVFRRRTEPSLRLDDVVFTLREFTANVEISDDEIRATWAQVEAKDRAVFLAELGDDQRDRLFVDGELIPEVPAVPLGLVDSRATGT